MGLQARPGILYFPRSPQSRTQSNACARARMALALGKLNFPCAVIGLTFINRACRQRTGTPKFRGSGCQFPQSQCHPSPRTGIALGTRLRSPQWFGHERGILIGCLLLDSIIRSVIHHKGSRLA